MARRNGRSASLPVPPPLRPSELARLNLPPPPQNHDFENEQWTRFSAKVGRLAGHGNGDDAWGWNGALPRRSYKSPSLMQDLPQRNNLPERRSTAPAVLSGIPGRSRQHSCTHHQATVALSRTPSMSSSSSRSSTSSGHSSHRVHFLEPLPPTEDDATDFLIRRLLAAFDTTGWCSLVERALEFPLPKTMDASDHAKDRLGSHMAKSLTGLADMIKKGDLGRCRSDPLLCAMALRDDDESDLENDNSQNEEDHIYNRSWWSLGDLMTLVQSN